MDGDNMKIKNFLSAITLTIFVPIAPINAATFNVIVNGDEYEVTTQEGEFDDLFVPFLGNQVWWGNATLADAFAQAVWDGLGTPNAAGQGPVFAYDPGGTWFLGRVHSTIHSQTTSFTQRKNVNLTFATATEVVVPLPAGVFLLLSGLGGIAALKSRRKYSRNSGDADRMDRQGLNRPTSSQNFA